MNIIEENSEEIFAANRNEVVEEKERITEELKKIDVVRRVMEGKYPPYGIIKDFIDHLASTEKVFILAGIKNFGGEEIMRMFIDSETNIMSNETGIEADVFNRIKDEFLKTEETADSIKDVADKLREKFTTESNRKFIEYLEEEMILLIEISDKKSQSSFDIKKEKEIIIEKMMVEIAENDKAEVEKLKEIYNEFKIELNNF